MKGQGFLICFTGAVLFIGNGPDGAFVECDEVHDL
jgi:hypothetical protein